jgi:hypothetical protein
MLRAKILRLDGSIVVTEAEIQGQNARRGTGDGQIWRGKFTIPPIQRQPTPGETLVISLAEQDRALSAVVTFVEDSEIHFRAPGRVPSELLIESH